MVRQVNIWKYIAALKGLTREFDRSSGLLNIARTAEVVNAKKFFPAAIDIGENMKKNSQLFELAKQSIFVYEKMGVLRWCNYQTTRNTKQRSRTPPVIVNLWPTKVVGSKRVVSTKVFKLSQKQKHTIWQTNTVLFYMVPHSHPHASGLSVWHRMKIKSHANSFKDYARCCTPPCREDVMLQSITKYLRLNLVFIWNSSLWEKFTFCFLSLFC